MLQGFLGGECFRGADGMINPIVATGADVKVNWV